MNYKNFITYFAGMLLLFVFTHCAYLPEISVDKEKKTLRPVLLQPEDISGEADWVHMRTAVPDSLPQDVAVTRSRGVRAKTGQETILNTAQQFDNPQNAAFYYRIHRMNLAKDTRDREAEFIKAPVLYAALYKKAAASGSDSIYVYKAFFQHEEMTMHLEMEKDSVSTESHDYFMKLVSKVSDKFQPAVAVQDEE